VNGSSVSGTLSANFLFEYRRQYSLSVSSSFSSCSVWNASFTISLSVHNEVPSHFEATLLICYNSSSELHNTTHINIFLFVHIQENRTRLSTVGNKSAMSVLCSFLFSKLHGIFALLIIIHTKTVSTVSTPESLCSLHFEATLLKRVQMNDFHWPILSAEKSRRSCHLRKFVRFFKRDEWFSSAIKMDDNDDHVAAFLFLLCKHRKRVNTTLMLESVWIKWPRVT